MEMGIAVISGNLPLLRPLFENFFRLQGSTFMSKGSKSQSQNHSRTGVLSKQSRGLGSKLDAEGFERISEDETQAPTQANSVQDIELGDRTILVRTDFRVEERSLSREEELGHRVKSFATREGK
jgi:hypothetical protein